jgi:hypothetical protein
VTHRWLCGRHHNGGAAKGGDRVIATVTLNPSFDRTIEVPTLVRGLVSACAVVAGPGDQIPELGRSCPDLARAHPHVESGRPPEDPP